MRRASGRVALALVALATLAAGRSFAQAPARPTVLVVAHRSVGVDALTRQSLRELILWQRRFWESGSRVELIVVGTAGPARRAFLEDLGGMSEPQFKQHWIGQIFSQRATSAPRAAPDRRLALALVAALPGAITLVEEGPLPPGVKVLRVDGLAPTDARSPLR